MLALGNIPLFISLIYLNVPFFLLKYVTSLIFKIYKFYYNLYSERKFSYLFGYENNLIIR